MPKLQRTNLLTLLAFAAAGVGAGLLGQLARSAMGLSPLIPPFSLGFTLLVIAVMLLGFGIALRRAVTRKSGKAVNPFHAVRLLAAARAGQFAGVLFGGFATGLVLQLLTRSVMPPSSTWLPMLFVLGSAILLVVCGIVTELLCRVPPSEGDEGEQAEPRSNIEPEPGAA